MQITFAPLRSDAAVLVLPVEKDGLARVDWGNLADARPLAQAAAAAQRFDGEAGAIVELFAPGEPVRRVLLLGIGGGDEGDWAKAGGALTARLLTGATEATVDLSGASPTRTVA